MDRTRRLALSCLLVGVLCLTTFFAATIAAGASGKPSAKVVPRVGIADFDLSGAQFVTVTWSNFPRGSYVYARQCVRGARDIESQCSQGGALWSACGRSCPGTQSLGPSDGKGSGTASARVAIGLINAEENLEPIDGRSFSCSYKASERCSLFVMWDVDDLRKSVEVPLAFAKPTDTCPTQGTYLPGSGAGVGQRMFQGLAMEICHDPTNVGLQYTTLFSGSAAVDDLIASVKSEFGVGSTTFYAVTPRALGAGQQDTITEWKAKVASAPVSASGLVIAYRLYDRRTQEQVRDLVLTPEQIARIFSGQLTSWNDPSILELNPRLTLPNQISPYMRGDACDETYELTSWFFSDAAARKAWIEGGKVLGKDNPYTKPGDIIPSLSPSYALVTGAKAEASAVALDQIDTSTIGVVGYMDSSWAALYNLPTVRIKLANGDLVEANERSIAQAVAAMKPDESGIVKPNFAEQDESHWPMPTVGYAVVPWDAAGAINVPDPKIQTALERLLRYIATTGQQHVPPGYVPLSAPLLAQTKAIADGIKEGVDIPPIVDPSAPPTQTPTATSTFGTGTGGSSMGVDTPTDTSGGADGSDGTGEPGATPSTVVIVQETPPPPRLALSAARLLLPGFGGVGILLTGAGLSLLFSKRLARLVPFGRARRAA